MRIVNKVQEIQTAGIIYCGIRVRCQTRSWLVSRNDLDTMQIYGRYVNDVSALWLYVCARVYVHVSLELFILVRVLAANIKWVFLWRGPQENRFSPPSALQFHSFFARCNPNLMSEHAEPREAKTLDRLDRSPLSCFPSSHLRLRFYFKAKIRAGIVAFVIQVFIKVAKEIPKSLSEKCTILISRFKWNK